MIPTNEQITRPALVISAVVFAALVTIAFYLIFPSEMDRIARRLYNEAKQPGLLGLHELEISKEGIVEKTEFNESRQSWRGVEKIVPTETHLFIFISSISAHVIPRHEVNVGELEQFIAQAEQWWQEAN